MWSGWLALATAGTLTGWSLDEGVWFVEDVALMEADTGGLHVDQAYLFQVRDPSGEAGGVVMVGAAEATVRAGSTMQAHVMANRLSVQQAPTRDVLAAAEGTWTASVDRGLWLGRSATLPPTAHRLIDGQRGVVYEGPDGRAEVVVTALMGAATARMHAQELLQGQVTRWTQEWMDPAAPATLDSLDAEPRDRWLAGLRLADGAPSPLREGRWLTWTHDPTGVLRFGRSGEVRGILQGEALAWSPLPATDEHGSGADRRWDLQGAGVTAGVSVEPGGLAADIGVVADLQLSAVGDGQQLLVLDVPHQEQKRVGDSPPFPDAFELVDLRLEDGTELRWAHVALTPQQDGRGSRRTFAAALPGALADGEDVTVRVRWADRVRYANIVRVSSGPASTYHQLDLSTGLLPAMPVVRGHDGAAAPVVVRAGAAGVDRRDRVVLPGRALGQERRDGVEWRTAETTSVAATFAAGRFDTGTYDAEGGPTIETYLHARADAREEARRIGQIATLIDPVIPEWPDAVRAVSAKSTYMEVPAVVGVGNGGLETRPTYNGDARQPMFSPGSHVATALAHDRWFSEPMAGEAAEVGVVGGWLVGWWALQAAAEDWDRDHWLNHMRSQSRPNGSSLVRYDHEGYHRLAMAAEALPQAFGERAVRQAFTEVLAGRYERSWAGVAQALEDASGIEAHGYVTLWLASDVRPSLDVRWRHDPERGLVVARVDSDAPYGSMPLTLELRGADGPVQVPLSLHDGVARASVPWEGQAPTRVAVDAGPHRVARTRVRAADR